MEEIFEIKNKDNIFEIKNVGLYFDTKNGKRQVLQSVDFSLKKNEFVSVIGDSGCGKSTLLRILAGYLKPSSGEVFFENQIHDKPNAKVGVMFQQSTLYPWLNLLQNVGFSSKMRKDSKRRQKEIAEHYLEAVGLREFAKNYPYECSGGMQSRASLAQVLACEPDVILMDEPFSALDAFTKRSMQDLIRFIYSKLQASVFFITHDIEEALYLSDRILIMKPTVNGSKNIVETLEVKLAKEDRVALESSREFIKLKEYLYARIKEKYDYVI